jgi:chemotaxis protein histidine kinase CheA
MSDSIQKSEVSIVPSADLKGLEMSLSDLAAARGKLPALEAQMREMNVNNKDGYAAMGLKVMEARAVLKQGEEIIRPYLNKVKLVQDFLRTQLNNHEATAKIVADIGAAKQEEFNRLERLATQREQEERDRINRQKAEAEAKRLREEAAQKAAQEKDRKIQEIREQLKRKEITKRQAEKLLAAAGATEEAALAKAAADAEDIKNNPVKETVLPNKTTVAGQRARAPLVYTIIDINLIPRELLYPNRDQKTGEWKNEDFPRLNKMVRDAKSEKAAEAEAGGGIKVRRDDRV